MVLVISPHDSHERFTRSDREVEARIEEHVDGEARTTLHPRRP